MKQFILLLTIAALLLTTLAVRADEIVAVTQLASGREMMNLHGVKKLCLGVHPLPARLKSKAITEAGLVDIISEQVGRLGVDIEPKTATHILSLQLKEDGENAYDLLLKVTSNTGPIWSLKMKATMSGNYPRRINELVKRGTQIFCRNYQIANSSQTEKKQTVFDKPKKRPAIISPDRRK